MDTMPEHLCLTKTCLVTSALFDKNIQTHNCKTANDRAYNGIKASMVISNTFIRPSQFHPYQWQYITMLLPLMTATESV